MQRTDYKFLIETAGRRFVIQTQTNRTVIYEQRLCASNKARSRCLLAASACLVLKQAVSAGGRLIVRSFGHDESVAAGRQWATHHQR